MRDIALMLVFAGLLPFALRYTWVGVLLWTWFSIMNPHKLAWGFAYDFPFAFVAALATLLSMLWNQGRIRIPRDATTAAIVAFSLWMCVTTYFAIYPTESLRDLDTAIKIQLMTLVAILALRERRHIEWFIWVNVISIGFYGVKGGLFTLLTGGGGRVWGPRDSFIYGNNELGLALTMTIPLMNYLRLVSPHKLVRLGLVVMMLLSTAAVLGTQSRGALLALVAMAAVLWWRSRRKLVGMALLSLIGVALVTFMPATWEERMRSIGTYQEDGSALSRFNSWITAVNIANDRVTGGGFFVETPQVFLRYSPNPDWVFTAHSIYFQPLGEHGWIGLLLFLSIGATATWTTWRLRRAALQQQHGLWLHELAGMIQVSMAGYAVGGAFLSLTYFDLPYNVAVIVVACKYWLIDKRWKTETTGALGAGQPAGAVNSAGLQRPLTHA